MAILMTIVLETDRYRLRIPTVEDIPSIYSATKYQGFNDGMAWDAPNCQDELLESLAHNNKAWSEGKGYSFTIEEKNGKAFLGRISIRKTDVEDTWNVGFWTHPEVQGKGIMTESLSEVLRFGFDKLRANKIEACHALWNEPSKRVLVKNKFIFHSYIAKGFVKNGSWVEENKLILTREIWMESKHSIGE